jgi:hypothetical protein
MSEFTDALGPNEEGGFYTELTDREQDDFIEGINHVADHIEGFQHMVDWETGRFHIPLVMSLVCVSNIIDTQLAVCLERLSTSAELAGFEGMPPELHAVIAKLRGETPPDLSA